MVRAKYFFEQLKEASDKIFNQTIATKKDLRASRILDFNQWFDALNPSSSHPILDDIIFSVANSIEASYFLNLHGFYDSANSELRNALDGLLTRIYFLLKDLSCSSPVKIKEDKSYLGLGKAYVYEDGDVYKKEYNSWLRGGDFPRFGTVLKKIFSKKEFIEYDKRFNLKNEIIDFYLHLSKWVHTRPSKNHLKTSTKSSILNCRFNNEEFDNWEKNRKRFYDYYVIFLLLSYPQLKESGNFKSYAQINKEIFNKINLIKS